VGVPVSGVPKRKIREAVKVQDGHSLGEQAVYAALWGAGQPNGDDCRRVTMGYRALSDACGLTVNNCKANLQALKRKLAIEEIQAATATQGTTYIVHSYQAILRRRRAAGMTHVIKSKGVLFVDRDSGIPITGTPVSHAGTPLSGTPRAEPGAPVPDISGTPDAATPLKEEEVTREIHGQEPSSSAFPLVVAAARKYGVILDDDAARRIVLRCQAYDEAATEAEVAYFVEAKIDQLRKGRVDNWPGLLIRAVPEYFAPPSTELRRLREERAREAAAQEALARQILSDPAASESEREWAGTIVLQARTGG
jgi:hypothetical protein